MNIAQPTAGQILSSRGVGNAAEWRDSLTGRQYPRPPLFVLSSVPAARLAWGDPMKALHTDSANDHETVSHEAYGIADCALDDILLIAEGHSRSVAAIRAAQKLAALSHIVDS